MSKGYIKCICFTGSLLVKTTHDQDSPHVFMIYVRSHLPSPGSHVSSQSTIKWEENTWIMCLLCLDDC